MRMGQMGDAEIPGFMLWGTNTLNYFLPTCFLKENNMPKNDLFLFKNRSNPCFRRLGSMSQTLSMRWLGSWLPTIPDRR